MDDLKNLKSCWSRLRCHTQFCEEKISYFAFFFVLAGIMSNPRHRSAVGKNRGGSGGHGDDFQSALGPYTILARSLEGFDEDLMRSLYAPYKDLIRTLQGPYKELIRTL